MRRSHEAALYLQSLGFETVSQNGQRISTSLHFDRQQMDRVKWNEVFIGKLPRDMFEDELLPHLTAAGPVYRIRYMMDFSHTNRGFCFVQYASLAQAVAAIRRLDGLTVKVGLPPIGAKISFDNKCLFFSDLPAWCTEKELIAALKQAEVDGIVRVHMFGPSPAVASMFQLTTARRSSGGGRGRGRNGPKPSRFSGDYSYHNNGPPAFCPALDEKQNAFVHFESHDAATRARRLLLPGDVKLFNRRIKLDWAKSEIPPEVANLLKQQQSIGPQAGLMSSFLPTAPSQSRDDHLRQRTQSAGMSGSSSSSSSLSTNDSHNEQLAINFINKNTAAGLCIGNHNVATGAPGPFSESDLWSLPTIASPSLRSLAIP